MRFIAKYPVDRWLAVGIAAILVMFVAYPWLQTIAASGLRAAGFSLAAYANIFGGEGGRAAVLNSLAISACSVIFSAAVGIFFAVALRYTVLPFRQAASVIAALPLAMPPLVGAAAFFFLFSESGLLPRVLQLVFSVPAASFRIEGFWAVVAIHAYSFYVFFYFLVDDALRTLDASEIESARLLGAGRRRIALRVVAPHLAPALARAALLVFISSLASFSAPLLFGGGMRFMTTEIYNAKVNGSFADAAAYSALLSMFSVGVLFILRGARKGMKNSGRAFLRQKRSRADSALALVTWLFLLITLLPFAMLVLLAFATEGAWTTQMLPPAYTFENFISVFRGGGSFGALLTSVLLGLAAAGITLVGGMAAAYAVARSSLAGGGKKALEFLSTFPMAIPGTVVGINILLAFSAPHFFTGGVVLAGTGAALIVAYCTRTLPFVVQSVEAGFAGIPADLEEAAATLGAGKLRTAREIFSPLLVPSLISGAAIAFVTAFGEFPASALLYTPNIRPASVEVLQQLRVEGLGSAAALGIVMVAVSSVMLLYGRGRDTAFTPTTPPS